jgi:hypothetical protein
MTFFEIELPAGARKALCDTSERFTLSAIRLKPDDENRLKSSLCVPPSGLRPCPEDPEVRQAVSCTSFVETGEDQVIVRPPC